MASFSLLTMANISHLKLLVLKLNKKVTDQLISYFFLVRGETCHLTLRVVIL